MNFSHYWWQVKYAEMEIDDIHHDTYPDSTLYNEKVAVHGARRQRLWMDFEKDETEKMHLLQKDFYHKFKMSKNQVREEMEEFGGTLEDYYHYCDKTNSEHDTKD